MIVTEKITINGNSFIRTFSDSGYMVEREGVRYAEAIDPAEFARQYTETGERIECYAGELTETEQKALAYDILMGVRE